MPFLRRRTPNGGALINLRYVERVVHRRCAHCATAGDEGLPPEDCFCDTTLYPFPLPAGAALDPDRYDGGEARLLAALLGLEADDRGAFTAEVVADDDLGLLVGDGDVGYPAGRSAPDLEDVEDAV